MKSILPENVQKYLDKYSSEKWNLEIEPELQFDCVIVVPAISEHNNIIALLNSLSENEINKDYRVAVIFVINSIETSSQEVKVENQKSLQLFKEVLSKNFSYHPVVEKINSTYLTIGFIDASSDGKEMPEKTGGVGLARKIGMDLALTIFDYTNFKKKILICLDADCTIEKNYIEEIINSFNTRNINAATINYEHPLPEDEGPDNHYGDPRYRTAGHGRAHDLAQSAGAEADEEFAGLRRHRASARGSEARSTRSCRHEPEEQEELTPWPRTIRKPSPR